MPESRFDLVCRECGSRRSALPDIGPGPCAGPEVVAGFVIDHVDVTLLGRCVACARGHGRDVVSRAG